MCYLSCKVQKLKTYVMLHPRYKCKTAAIIGLHNIKNDPLPLIRRASSYSFPHTQTHTSLSRVCAVPALFLSALHAVFVCSAADEHETTGRSPESALFHSVTHTKKHTHGHKNVIFC